MTLTPIRRIVASRMVSTVQWCLSFNSSAREKIYTMYQALPLLMSGDESKVTHKINQRKEGGTGNKAIYKARFR